MKKRQLLTIITLLTGLFLLSNVAFSQEVTLKMKNGKEVKGVLLSLETDLVAIDPDGFVTYLSLSSADLESLTFIDGTVLKYPITQDMIPEKYRNKKAKTASNTEGHYYKSYVEMYLLGGFSSRTNLMNRPSLSLAGFRAPLGVLFGQVQKLAQTLLSAQPHEIPPSVDYSE